MFVGREEEVASLRATIDSKAPKVALIYGRRRIGKTALIRKAIGKESALFIEGLENRPTQAQPGGAHPRRVDGCPGPSHPLTV